MLTQAGLRHVTQISLDLPIGAWDTQMGTLMEENYLTGFKAVKPVICQQLQLDPTEFDRQVAVVRHEWEQRHSFARYYLAYGQI